MTEPRRLPLETWGRHWLLRLQTAADRAAWSRYGFEFLMFGIKQGWACLFGGAMLALLLATHLWWPEGVPVSRYDFLVVGALVEVHGAELRAGDGAGRAADEVAAGVAHHLPLLAREAVIALQQPGVGLAAQQGGGRGIEVAVDRREHQA